MINFFAYIGLITGVVFTILYLIVTPISLKYIIAGKPENKSKSISMFGCSLISTGLLNIVAMIIMVIFSHQLLVIIFCLLLIAMNISQEIVKQWNEKKKDLDVSLIKPNLFSWLSFLGILIFTGVLRTLPFIIYLWL